MKLFVLFLSLSGIVLAADLRSEYNQLRLRLAIQDIESKCAHKTPCAPQIPLKKFFRNPEYSGFQISPNGKYLSFLAPVEGRMNVFVTAVANLSGKTMDSLSLKQKKQLTSIKDRDVAGYFWKGKETIVYMRDFGGDENFHLFSVNIHSGKEVDLTPFEGVKTNVVDDLKDHPDLMLVGMNKRDRKVFDVYRVNVSSGKMSMVVSNPGNVLGWVTDHQGKVRMASMSDGVNTTLLYRSTEEEPFRPILTTNFRESVSPLFFDFDNQKVYAASNLGRDTSAIVKFDPETGKETSVLFSHPHVDVSSLSYSRKEKKLISIIYKREKTKRKFLHKGWKKLYEGLKDRLPGLEVAILDHDDEEENFIVRTYSDRSLGSTYFYSKITGSLKKIYNHSKWLNPDEMAPMIPIQYKSRDGLEIPGYLTLPLKKNLKNLPLVVNPHGGPWARNSWGFNPEVQYLANKGYAVLQMNFRGSTGYGRKFWEASFKKWGQEMQNDITDGVQWLIDQGLVDSKRIGIYGGSYGGYAVLAGLAFTPDLYACGVDYVGVSNIFTLLETLPPYWKPLLEMMYEMVGHPEKDKDLLKKVSPVFHVDQIKAPLLIAQGARDPRVKKSESDQMVEALKKRGIEVPYLVKENEGHGFRNEENRFEFYKKAGQFLDRHLMK